MSHSERFWRVLTAASALWLLALATGCGDPTGTGLPLPTAGTGDVDTTPAETPSTPTGSTSDGTSGGTSSHNTTNPDASDPCLKVGEPASPFQRDMFVALNQYRRSLGLVQLSYSKVLERAASVQAQDLYGRDFFDHVNPDGDGPLERALAAGFCRAYMIGENIAWNQQSVAEVQRAWELSPGHNANMIHPDFRYVGMGYYDSANGPYYVQLFGSVQPD